MMKSLLKLLLLILELFQVERRRYENRKFKENVAAIRRDPVTEWNRRFGRVQPVPDEADRGQLPAAPAKPAARDQRDGGFVATGHGGADDLYG